MQFNSIEFLIFAVGFFALWPLVKRRDTLRWSYLAAASFVFYGWWDWRFIFLLLGSGMVDFWAALGMTRFGRLKKLLLIISIFVNVGFLATFKYLNFCVDNTNMLVAWLDLDSRLLNPNVLLPIGISFYTFQSLSYTIDVYRGLLKPTRNIAHFFAYLAMFPQLVAGPIIRARDLLPQLKQHHPSTEEQRWEGMKLIVHGFFKKIVIADSLAPVINYAFSSGSTVNSCSYWWLIIFLFALQIYCDFSGYTDIARGLARWMGYNFPLNFNHPYLASSFRDFWSRWHISLSTWFRDYVYIPLGGSRRGTCRNYFNLWITMLVSGLWHGAAWTFVIWGGLHALYLVVERITAWPRKMSRLPGGKFLSILLVFILCLIGWTFFRAESLGQTWHILGVMFNFKLWAFQNPQGLVSQKIVFLILVMILYELYYGLNWNLVPQSSILAQFYLKPVAFALMLVACVFLRGPGSTFIYFRF